MSVLFLLVIGVPQGGGMARCQGQSNRRDASYQQMLRKCFVTAASAAAAGSGGRGEAAEGAVTEATGDGTPRICRCGCPPALGAHLYRAPREEHLSRAPGGSYRFATAAETGKQTTRDRRRGQKVRGCFLSEDIQGLCGDDADDGWEIRFFVRPSRTHTHTPSPGMFLKGHPVRLLPAVKGEGLVLASRSPVWSGRLFPF
ncbi:unnamed protein product [Gadus morhua 'NCC']